MSYLNRTLSKMPIRLDMPRSGIHTNTRRFTSFNAGKLVPLFRPIEVLPGDTFDVRTGYVLRTSNPPVRPVFDRAWLDIAYYFVPMRLVWEHTKEFFGENNTSYWVPERTYQIPQLEAPANGFAAGSVADHLYSLPPGVDVGSFSALEARGYALIWNEYYRDQNYQSPAAMPKGEAVTYGVDSLGSPLINAVKGGELLPVNKYHDYFTSALPSPQKAAQGVSITGNEILPVLTYNELINKVAANKSYPIHFDRLALSKDGELRDATPHVLFGLDQTTLGDPAHNSYAAKNAVSTNVYQENFSVGAPLNLGVDGSLIGDINQLRFAFQLQKFYERQALGGTRFREQLYSMYGSTIPDATSQIPEFLGGTHQQLGVQQVMQTSASVSGQTPQANAAAYSYTANGGRSFIKSFCEPGWVYVLGCVRTDHTYQQGINRQFARHELTDFYNPLFANLGAQPIFEWELKGYDPADDETPSVIGYQEAWAEYRYLPADVAGQMRSGVTGTLDVWHYADYYDPNDSVMIDGSFMEETVDNIDRTLSVQSKDADQFIMNIAFDIRMYRVMPLYSVPGLIDHH